MQFCQNKPGTSRKKNVFQIDNQFLRNRRQGQSAPVFSISLQIHFRKRRKNKRNARRFGFFVRIRVHKTSPKPMVVDSDLKTKLGNMFCQSQSGSSTSLSPRLVKRESNTNCKKLQQPTNGRPVLQGLSSSLLQRYPSSKHPTYCWTCHSHPSCSACHPLHLHIKNVFFFGTSRRKISCDWT